MISGKVWGVTSLLLNSPFVEVSHISVMPSSFSSKHRHRNKDNFFYCIKGFVLIKAWKDDRKGNIDTTVLMPGQSTVIRAHEYHKFETPTIDQLKQQFPDWDEDSDRIEILEVYTPPPINVLDIEREDTGGSLYTVNELKDK